MVDLAIVATLISPLIVVACLAVGYVLKHAVPTEKVDNFIPLIVMVLGIILNLWAVGWVITLEACVVGAISGLASTGLYEAFTQILKIGDDTPQGKHIQE